MRTEYHVVLDTDEWDEYTQGKFLTDPGGPSTTFVYHEETLQAARRAFQAGDYDVLIIRSEKVGEQSYVEHRRKDPPTSWERIKNEG